MHPEVRELIDRSSYHQGAVLEVRALLPPDDAELDRWLEEVVRERDQVGFLFLLMAAQSAERKVDARHLVGGTVLMPDVRTLGCSAWQMEGDIADALLQAVRAAALAREIHAGALFIAAAWCRERRDGVLPPDLIVEARILARYKDLSPNAWAFLGGLAVVTGDQGLFAVLHRKNPKVGEDVALKSAQKLAESMVALFRHSAFHFVPTEAVHQGGTIRRSVARIGRNDPCHCGSGKKHKRCCYEKDQERLRHSTEVAGKTMTELRAEPEPHLTLPRLKNLPVHELARLDPLKINSSLLPEYLERLGGFRMFDLLASAFEKLGCPHELHAVWERDLIFVTRAGRKDIAERMVKVRYGEDTSKRETLGAGVRLLLARDDPDAFLGILEEVACEALCTEDSDKLGMIAYGIMMNSRTHALGILVARSMVPVVDKTSALSIFDEILLMRDRLKLSPDDPFADIIDLRFTEEVAGNGQDTQKLREAQRKLEAKAAEVRQMKTSLDQLRREFERREKASRVKAETPSSAAVPADEQKLRELREKIVTLKSALKERHDERAELRRELEKAHNDLDTLRHEQHAAPGSDEHHADSEDAMTSSIDLSGNQPVRIIEFPSKFHETLNALPRQTSRATMTMLGRVAAGEPAAFAGVVRIKALPHTLRQRIGSDYRLLFRLHPDRVEVIDLINRRDLERRIKTLV